MALQRLINALGPDSTTSYGILQPLLQHCTNPNQACILAASPTAFLCRKVVMNLTNVNYSVELKSCSRLGSAKGGMRSMNKYPYALLSGSCSVAKNVDDENHDALVQADELNLLEDGLQLWLIALRNAPGPQSWLLDLFPNLCAVMEKSTGERAVFHRKSKNAHLCNYTCAGV